jgi:phenylacetate-CoA ligase
MSTLSDIIYSKTPKFIQNIGISIFGIKWYFRRFGGIYKHLYEEFKLRENYSKSEWDDFKVKELRRILIYASKNVAYYKREFSRLDLFVENFVLSDLKKIPMLEKDILRVSGSSDLLSTKLESGGEYYSSSGSTGTPTKILFSKRMHQRYAAAHEARCRNWAGITKESSRGMIGGRRVLPSANDGPPFHRYNFIEKQAYFSAYHIAPKNAQDYVDAMWKCKVEYMTGYAVSNYLLAKYILELGLNVPKMKAVITSSEKLTLEMRTVLEEVYQCQVFDGWSGVEACGMVTECEYGSLHISEDVGILEILDEDGNEVAEGETGEVVCTGFLNYDQPLIRYRIGDRMTKGIGTCKCGRQMPVIQEIEGRLEDVVTGPDGRQMVRFHSVFIGIPSIERTQVIQHTIDHIEIKIQNEISLTEEEMKLINTRVISQLGQIQLDINQHLNIEQSKSGKYKAVVSHLKK